MAVPLPSERNHLPPHPEETAIASNSLVSAALLAYAPDLSAFVTQHGRLPRVGDVPAPWHYRRWLLPYVILLFAQLPAIAGRWGYPHRATHDENSIRAG